MRAGLIEVERVLPGYWIAREVKLVQLPEGVEPPCGHEQCRTTKLTSTKVWGRGFTPRGAGSRAATRLAQRERQFAADAARAASEALGG